MSVIFSFELNDLGKLSFTSNTLEDLQWGTNSPFDKCSPER